MKLEPVTSVEHLLRQIRDNAENDIFCMDPQVLEQKWGVPIFGWRDKAGLTEHVVKFDLEGRALPSTGPMGEFLVRSYIAPSNQHGFDISFRPSRGRGQEVISLDVLKQLFGPSPEFHQNLHPHPPSALQTRGEHPDSAAFWKAPRKHLSVTADLGMSSQISSVYLTYSGKKK